MLIGLVIADIMLIMEPPSADKPPWMVPLVSFFVLLFLIMLFSSRADQALGRKIRATGDAVVPPKVEPAIQPRQANEVLPVPAFSIEVLKAENLPPLSPAANLLLQRGRSFYDERLRIYRRGIWFLLLAHVTVALLSRAFGNPYPIPSSVWSWLLVAIAALIVLGHPRRMRLVLVPVAWWILSAAWVAVTVILAAIYAVRAVSERDPASGLLALVTTGAVVVYTLRLRRGNLELRQKVMANPPLKLLFLWVFGSFSPASLFLGFAAVWRFLGSIQLLNGAGFMGDTAVILKSFARGRSEDLIVKTPEELAARIRDFNDAPNRMAMYPHHALLCSDSVWKQALHTVLTDTDVILMDLRAFSPENQGAAYELGQLIDRFPTDRFVLLADETTDADFLATNLCHAWEAMATDSPNRRSSSGPVRVFQLRHGSAKGAEFQLPTIAREGDRLIEVLCECAVARLVV
jgi:hypothetical protein